jgi:hypothetical protein
MHVPLLGQIRVAMGTVSGILIAIVVSSALNAPREWENSGPQPEYHVVSFALANWILAVVVVMWVMLLASALLTALLYDEWPYAAGSCLWWGLLLLFTLILYWHWFNGHWIDWLLGLLVATFLVMISCLLLVLFADKFDSHRTRIVTWRDKLHTRVISMGSHRPVP